MPIWGDVELAWRLDRAGRYGPPRRWLVVTGTNGKTTTTSMLHAMLIAGGRGAACCAATSATRCSTCSAEPAELLAVELSSFQLHWAPSLRPEAGVVLNIAEDHWTGTARWTPTPRDKARALDGRVAVVGLDDPVAAGLLAPRPPPVRVGFRLGEPAPGELGVRDGVLVDRAFADGLMLRRCRRRSRCRARSVCSTRWPPRRWPAPSACPPRRSPRRWRRSRWARTAPRWSASVDGVTYVDDSKATNPHAAQASIAAYPRVVWIAGGLLKGASVDELVAEVANRLVGAVLIGRDRAAGCQGVIATRARCPRRGGCDGGGCWGA